MPAGTILPAIVLGNSGRKCNISGVATLSNVSAGHPEAARIDSLGFSLLKSMQ